MKLEKEKMKYLITGDKHSHFSDVFTCLLYTSDLVRSTHLAAPARQAANENSEKPLA